MDLTKYAFPIEERPIAVPDGNADMIDIDDRKTFLSSDHKALVRSDTNEVISIVRKSYKVVTNQELIESMLGQLDNLDSPSEIDENHSFCNNQQMRLMITFPEMTVKDRDSDIAMALYLHNSYDQSEAIKLAFGAFRYVCTNGMVLGMILGRYHRKHTAGLKLGDVQQSLSVAQESLPLIQTRINELQEMDVTPELETRVEKMVGKRMTTSVGRFMAGTQWDLYNALTDIISHQMQPRHQARYQAGVSKAFGL